MNCRDFIKQNFEISITFLFITHPNQRSNSEKSNEPPECASNDGKHLQMETGLAQFETYLSNLRLDMTDYRQMFPYGVTENSLASASEVTKVFFYKLVAILMSYIQDSNDRTTKVINFQHPHEIELDREEFSLDIDNAKPCSLADVLKLCRGTIERCVKTGHPRYMNQLSCGLDMITLAADWLISTANTNAFTYEIAPMFVIIEEIMLDKMRQLQEMFENKNKKSCFYSYFNFSQHFWHSAGLAALNHRLTPEQLSVTEYSVQGEV